MKKYIKFGKLALYQRMISTLLTVVEIAVLFILANIILAQFNNRYMIFEPYKDIINQEGFFVEFGTMDKILKGDMRTKEEVIQECEEKGAKIIKAYKLMTKIPEIGEVEIYFIDDSIFKKYSLPLDEGKYKLSKKDELYGVIGPNTLGVGADDKITVTGKTKEYNVTISGLLSNPTYKPNYFEAYSDDLANSCVKGFYTSYSLSNNPIPVILMSQNNIGEFIEDVNATMCEGMFLLFENGESLHERLVVSYNFAVSMDLLYFRRGTDEYLYDNLRKTFPLIAMGLGIILIGLIGTVSINVKNQIKNYGVYFLCGARWRENIRISLCSNGMMLVAASIITIIAYFVGNAMGACKKFGLVFELDNILLTGILMLIVFLVSAIIPIFMLRKMTPVEILRNEM